MFKMKGFSNSQAFSIVTRSIGNYLKDKPIVSSFETTLSCMAQCRHCDTGGHRKNEQMLAPEEFLKYIKELRPAMVQLSGGEPLLRKDLPEVVRTIRSNGTLPYIIVVTNGHLFNEEKYLELREAGANRFSVSLDFPNEKHDDFRRISGLYARLEKLIPQLASHGNGDIAMNCAITSANLPYLKEAAERCIEWGVDISYSAYSVLRTGDPQYFISGEDDLEMLRETMQDLIAMKRENGTILNPVSMLSNIHTFFKEGSIPNCNAGRRFLVVRPDGTMNACSMYRDRRYTTHKEMLEDFSDNNECGGCYVAIRAYSDKSLAGLFKDVVGFVRN